MQKDTFSEDIAGDQIQRRRWQWGTWAVLLFALIARVVLVCNGGQGFWPDEGRYSYAWSSAEHIARGELKAAAVLQLENPDHLLFKTVAILPAMLERWLGFDQRCAALFFSLFSFGIVWLAGKITERAGGDPGEVFLATGFSATATCLFYYARHLVPYDLSLFLFLAALYVGLGEGSWRMAAAGLLSGLGFLSYNTYWQLGGPLLIVLVLARRAGWKQFLLRAAAGAAGLVLPLAVVLLLARAWRIDIVARYLAFSQTANMGDLDIAWRFIPMYFRDSEHAIAGVWAAALLIGLVWIGRGRAPDRVWWWTGIALLALASMTVFSDVLDKFVVHARTARMVAPFFCLLAAAVVRKAGERWPTWLCLLAGALYLAQAAFNLAIPLRQMFPREFLRAAHRLEADLPKEKRADLHIMNGDFMHDPSHVVALPPGSSVLFSRPHPLHFRPYLYEGYMEEHRQLFEKLDLTMRVADVKLPDNLSQYATVGDLRARGGYPGPIRLTLQLPPMLEPKSEPLLTTGESTVGDFIYLFYNNASTLRVAFDHWSHGGPTSANLEIDYNQPLVVTLSTGALFPPVSGPEPEATRAVRELLFVQVNDRVIFAQKAQTYPATPNSVSFGCNFIGGSTTRPIFTGRILKIEAVSPEEILGAIKGNPLANDRK